MKRFVLAAAVLVVAAVTLRRFGPALAEQCTKKCHEMMGRMSAKCG